MSLKKVGFKTPLKRAKKKNEGYYIKNILFKF